MNQHQITMTGGDARTLAFVIDDEYEAETATLRVDGLFVKTAVVGADDGSGYATATFTVDADDTEDAPDHRRAYRYELSVSGVTVRRGLFVVTPELTDPA
jgi:hypothetical protein